MQVRSADWQTLYADPNHRTEYRAIVGGVTYGMDKIAESPLISSALFDDKLAAGSARVACAELSIFAAETIPRMASVVISSRLTDENGLTQSEWLPLGSFYIDTRKKDPQGWVDLCCYDSMLKSEQPYIDQNEESGTWPIPMADAVAEICTRIGVPLDERAVIKSGADYAVAYPNDLTMRQVLENIAAAHGGNWIITPANKLRLVPLASPSGSPIHEIGQNIVDFDAPGDAVTVSRVTLYDDADNSFTAGDDSGYHLEIDCLYATQNIANDLCNTTNGALYGMAYVPFEAASVPLDPAFELGDDLSLNGISSVIVSCDAMLTACFAPDIAAPGDKEVDHEYPYLTVVQRQFDKVVKLGTSYYGTTISRSDGLVIEKLVGGQAVGRLLANTETISMQAYQNGNWVDKLFFDTVTGTYKFAGSINVNDNFIVDANGNVTINGSIVWGASSSPVRVLYRQSTSTPSKPTADFSAYPVTGTTSWHQTYNTADNFMSYNYSGGLAANWTAAMKCQGKDGTNGSDATVTDQAVFNAMTSNGSMYGCFYGSNNRLYINADYIRTGYIDSDLIDVDTLRVRRLYGMESDDGYLYLSGSNFYVYSESSGNQLFRIREGSAYARMYMYGFSVFEIDPVDGELLSINMPTEFNYPIYLNDALFLDYSAGNNVPIIHSNSDYENIRMSFTDYGICVRSNSTVLGNLLY